MALLDYAESELNLIGMTDDGDMNGMMRKHLLHMVKEFADEGHSGFSASYALQCLQKLLKFKPLSPLTGADDEWVKHDYGVEPTYQNKRLSSVFKDADGNAYNIDGKVFWEWCMPYEGREPQEPYKSYYTCRDSRVPVTFPYTAPDEPIYEYRWSDADPRQPKQDENGFID